MLENKKVVFGSVGVIFLVILGFSLFGGSSKQAPQVEYPPAVGSVTSPEISDNHISVNGVTTWTLRQNMAVATTTLCSFPNPAGSATSTFVGSGINVGTATSSLVSIGVQIMTGTSTAAFFDIATSTSQFATSSPAFAYGVSVPSGAQYSGSFTVSGGTGSATSSDAKLTSSLPDAGNIIKPGEIVNVKTSTPGLGGYTYTGQCIATFRSLNFF